MTKSMMAAAEELLASGRADGASHAAAGGTVCRVRIPIKCARLYYVLKV